MIETLINLERKVNGARELKQVVRTMKGLAAANIRPCEEAVRALAEYYRTIQLGLIAAFAGSTVDDTASEAASLNGTMGIIIFGSDQGLAGELNETLAGFFFDEVRKYSTPFKVLVVGEQMVDQLSEKQIPMEAVHPAPDSVAGITPVVSRLLFDIEKQWKETRLMELLVFYNRPKAGALYERVSGRFLPLDKRWLAEISMEKWPSRTIPEVFQPPQETRSALIREYLFVRLFQASAEALASENISRFASMQRAGKNIDESLKRFQFQYHQFRQNQIDEELFDVVAGFETLFFRQR